jgi:hypothetical protein
VAVAPTKLQSEHLNNPEFGQRELCRQSVGRPEHDRKESGGNPRQGRTAAKTYLLALVL